MRNKIITEVFSSDIVTIFFCAILYVENTLRILYRCIILCKHLCEVNIFLVLLVANKKTSFVLGTDVEGPAKIKKIQEIFSRAIYMYANKNKKLQNFGILISNFPNSVLEFV